jgi:epsilon-lactone hydrolase
LHFAEKEKENRSRGAYFLRRSHDHHVKQKASPLIPTAVMFAIGLKQDRPFVRPHGVTAGVCYFENLSSWAGNATARLTKSRRPNDRSRSSGRICVKKIATLSLLIIATACAVGPGRALENTRELPARALPVPDTASPALQAMIAAPLPPWWNRHPKSAQEWKDFVQQRAAPSIKAAAALRETMSLKVEPTVIGGVGAFIVSPSELPEANRNRLLIHVHGGGYVFGPGEAGLPEALLMAGHGHFKVISIDYRMPPDFPYPAAIDDAMAVYKEILKTTDARKIGIFGTSTGGGMTMAMVLRAKAEGLPLPGAIAPGTPWSDMTKTGDTYFTNEMVDDVLVSNDGWLGDASALYANGHDLKDPMLSPIYGDLKGFPPTILTTGTRDLFLSNTVRVHRKLREAGVIADLLVFEGLSHAQYLFDFSAPETKEHFVETAAFLDKYLDR